MFRNLYSKFLKLATLSFAGLPMIKYGAPPSRPTDILIIPKYGMPNDYLQPDILTQILMFIKLHLSWIIALAAALLLAFYIGLTLGKKKK